MEVVSMLASMAVLLRSAGSYCTVPFTLLNDPRTVEIPKWRTENCGLEWLGSICHVPVCAAAEMAKQAAMVMAVSARRMSVFSYVTLQKIEPTGGKKFHWLGFIGSLGGSGITAGGWP